MENYKYISIPVNRLTEKWLKENNFNRAHDLDTFMSYDVELQNYTDFNQVELADKEFICNTQEEFEQKVAEYKLLSML